MAWADTKDAPDLQELIAKAAHGDAQAQLRLAQRYRDGAGVPQDYAEALRWGHRAADGGNAAARDFVGPAPARGTGRQRARAKEGGRWPRRARGVG